MGRFRLRLALATGRRDFGGVNLRRANLRGLCLAGCSLRRADLHCAEACRCDFTGADLTGADVYGLDLRGAAWDHTTIWPAGFSPSRHQCGAPLTAVP